jgi:tryptophanyl-tRNA synthetase
MSKIFSGMRPSGKLHLGNYLGAIKNWIELQNEAEQCIFAAVDLHAITTPYDPATFPQQVRDVLLDYLAAGVDPDKSLLIRQSKVPEHAELMWLLSTITPVSWLERLPNWREKVEQVESLGDAGSSYRNNLALLSYPVLMAADILLYKSDLVPIGDDQLPHIELTNELGTKFNHLFGNTFPKVKPFIADGSRIMSLKNPMEKMSKMGDSRILLMDNARTIREKMKRAVTDSGNEIKFDEKEKPAISNLLTIFSTLSGMPIGELEQNYDGTSYSEFKSDLAEVVVGFLEPLQKRRAELAADPSTLDSILERSE